MKNVFILPLPCTSCILSSQFVGFFFRIIVKEPFRFYVFSIQLVGLLKTLHQSATLTVRNMKWLLTNSLDVRSIPVNVLHHDHHHHVSFTELSPPANEVVTR